MSTALPAIVIAKVGKIIGQFGSDNPHVQTTAVAALRRVLSSGGYDLADLSDHITAAPREVAQHVERPTGQGYAPNAYPFGAWQDAHRRPHPTGPHRHRVERCRRVGGGHLSAWEAEFLASLERRLAGGLALTPKQVGALTGIAERLGVAG